ncbi:Ankyrin-3 [Colletotrichum aenigma]|uniref:Ankyrin-3 n=1 Tax=Colletotrichum aenigma TaxID=1215731 RepID=UPI0018725C4C|nr:Ankyrin-3 [Colletotrichum aenigma]KAF5517413.1 Ankyrin-3 [Colletotrichum aenigma]
MTGGVAESGAARIESFAKTPCFTYALRYYVSHYEAATPRAHAERALVLFMPTRQAYYCHSLWLAIHGNNTDHRISVDMDSEEQKTSSNSSKSAALFQLMTRGDYPKIVNGLVADGADINHVAGSGHKRVTLLSWAIICRRKNSFRALLRNGNVSINHSPDGTRGPLHHAARCVDDVSYIQTLIDHPDIDVNVIQSSSNPLHEALDSKNRLGVDALLAHPNIDLSITDSYGQTPYLKAFNHEMWEPFLLRIMTMLPQKSFSIPIPVTSQLLAAGKHGWTNVEEIFLKVFAYQWLTHDPDTNLHVLAHYAFFGHREKLLWIIDRLPTQRVSLRSGVDHYDLLHLCASHNWEDMVHMMQRKFRLQSLSSDHAGRTLLHWAMEYNWDIDKMDLSQYSVADLNKKDRDGLTAVHIAVINRNMAALEILVASGASYLQKDNAGMSPAHMAADQGYRAALVYFIDVHSADFGITHTGASLLHLIALDFDEAMIHHFVTSRKAAININSMDRERRTALHYAAMTNNASAVEALVKLRCSINGRDKNGKSAIHEAIRGGGADTALRLLDLGADWRATDAFDQTCLHLALRYNSEILVSHFLQLDMNIGAVDRFKMTPLHRACGAGNAERAREVLDRGAAWDARNMHGRSPLELAVEARATSTVGTVVSWMVTFRRAQISVIRRIISRYFDSALKLACELELDSTRIASILKEAGADIDYSQVKVDRVYLAGPTAEKRDSLVPRG